jgi:outer membrane cobalamin receptor
MPADRKGEAGNGFAFHLEKEGLMKRLFPVLLLLICLLSLNADAGAEAEKKKDEKQPMVTESVTVEAKLPSELPFASTSMLVAPTIEPMHASSAAELLTYVPGVYVTVGNKNEWGVKIRGLDTSRTTLLVDGIPVFEPYFNSYDLKTFVAADIGTLRVVKGASSVLYGPNTMGGIVDILTRRPNPPQFKLSAAYGKNDTFSLAGTGNLRLARNLVLLASAMHEQSDGFDYRTNGDTELRSNSDYNRTNLLAKTYLNLANGGELLGEISYYTTDYGLPPAASVLKSNYWRFKDWYRLSANIGGTLPFLAKGQIKGRVYYNKYYNVLDAYKSSSFTTLNWESTYDNHSYGAFALATAPLGGSHELQFSASLRADRVSQQGSVGAAWEEYDQDLYSFGAEDQFRISDRWTVHAGVGIDYLNKAADLGNDKWRMSPLAGIRFNVSDDLDLHLTLSSKSRFPTMKNLYSSTGGNPDLHDERATSLELGFALRRSVTISGAVFYNRVNNLIDKFNMPDGTFLYLNYKKARIAGFELEAEKSFGIFFTRAAYTYLDTRNISEDRPLDAVPESQFNLMLGVNPRNIARLTVWGQAISAAKVLYSKTTYSIPGYVLLNVSIERDIGPVTLFAKADNLFNKEYATDLGFPMRARTVMIGVQLKLGSAEKM